MLPSDAPRRGFSLKARAEGITALEEGTWDLLVIGGGITGAGIARDATLRGLRTAVVDAGDWGGGTSSRSSRLIHGGLRYLRNYQFRLVWEACHERAVIRATAPRLVKPLPFLLPVYRGGRDGLWKTSFGLWLYDRMAGRRGVAPHRRLRPEQVLALAPTLASQGLLGGGLYHDCAVDDARLTLYTLRTAWEKGATVANYAEAVEFAQSRGRITGAAVKDMEDVREFDVRSKVTIAAAGPWTDKLLGKSGIAGPRMLRPTKGIHLVVPRFLLDNETALALWNRDGRLVFVVPWGKVDIVGTTETPYEGDPRDPPIEDGDVEYLLEALNRLFPGAEVGRRDVIGAYAGVRPLVDTGISNPSSISREHSIRQPCPGLVVVAGGKLTTFRAMAKEVVDGVLHTLGSSPRNLPSRTDTEALALEAPPETREAILREVALPDDVVHHLLEAYGSEAQAVALRSKADGLQDRLVTSLPYIAAEVLYAAEEEMVVHLEDFLMRRTQVGLLGGGEAVEAAERVSELLAKALGWDEAQTGNEVAAFKARSSKKN